MTFFCLFIPNGSTNDAKLCKLREREREREEEREGGRRKEGRKRKQGETFAAMGKTSGSCKYSSVSSPPGFGCGELKVE